MGKEGLVAAVPLSVEQNKLDRYDDESPSDRMVKLKKNATPQFR